MRRALIATLAFSALALAQPPSRNSYRAAYQAWREADPTLELDAASAGTALEPRAQKAAQTANAFYTAREAFLAANGSPEIQIFLDRVSQVPEAALASPPILQRTLLVATQNVSSLLTTFTGDPDPAIQQLRQVLERERTAVEALAASINQRATAGDALVDANTAIEKAAAAALTANQTAATQRADLADQVNKEGAAWAAYYERLAQGARGVTVSSTSPTTTTAPAGGPVIAAPKPYVPKSSVAPLPLARYVGGWVFPPNGTYLGGQPQFVELTVREAGGHVTGTLYARFVLPEKSPGDPFVRFDFEGDLQSTREQEFALRTSEGATGTIQLIPGAVFNMIEVVFQTEQVENKVRAGNFILLKR